MNKAAVNWIKSSSYDITTAEAMLKAKRYIYVIFFCHLAVEKLLKGIACKITGKIPPKTHDLLYLAQLTNISLPEKHQILISRLNAVSVPTRYPEDIIKLTRQYNLSAADRYLKETRGLLKWLKQNQE